MQDLRAIIDAYDAARQSNRRVALATVVNVVGSAYRRAGARMIVIEGQGTTGSLSGGCLEKDVAIRALDTIETGVPQVLSYSTTGSADDYIFGVGQGCNGTVEIIIERLNPPIDDALDSLQVLSECMARRRTGVLVTLVGIDGGGGEGAASGSSDSWADTTLGAALWVDDCLVSHFSRRIKDANLQELISNHALHVSDERQSSLEQFHLASATVNAFFEFRQPPIQLLICGGGNDAGAVAAFARQLGWDVLLADTRNPGSILDGIRTRHRTAAVLMTHNYAHDLCFLQHTINAGLDYVGLLGPKHRREKLLQDLSVGGIYPSAEALERFYGPIGLDIGADNEQEVALSVVSEIQAALNGHRARFLRDKSGSIHAQNVTQPLLRGSISLNYAGRSCRTQD